MDVQMNEVLFKNNRFIGLEKVTVTKITPTGNIRVSDGSLLTPKLRKKTSDAWDNTMYYEWSQELEDKYQLQKLQSKIRNQIEKIDVSNLNKEALEMLNDVLEKVYS